MELVPTVYSKENRILVQRIYDDIYEQLENLSDRGSLLTCIDFQYLSYDGKYYLTNTQDISHMSKDERFKITNVRSPHGIYAPNDYILVDFNDMLRDLEHEFLHYGWVLTEGKVTEYYARGSWYDSVESSSGTRFSSELQLSDLPPAVQEKCIGKKDLLSAVYDVMTTIDLKTETFLSVRKEHKIWWPLQSLSISEDQPIFLGECEGQLLVGKPSRKTKNQDYILYDYYPNCPVVVGGKELKSYMTLMEYLKPVKTVTELSRVGQDILTNLMLLHQQGLVHNDIKPDNIMQKLDGTYVIIDFDDVESIGELRGLMTPKYSIYQRHWVSLAYRQELYAKPIDDLIEFGYTLNALVGNEPRFRAIVRNPMSDKIDAYLDYVCSLIDHKGPLQQEVYQKALSFLR